MKFAGEQTWITPKAAPPVAELASALLDLRGIDHGDFLAPQYDRLGDPFSLPDMKQAIDHLDQVRNRKGRVMVYGDYDIDGLTATTMMVEVLQLYGLQAEAYIPDRFEEGYGLHVDALMQMVKAGIDTVLTVDCGISAVEPIKQASEAGLNIIVTDHHAIPEEEPIGAVALINPLRHSNRYPERALAGVGVAFGLVRAMQQRDPDFLPAGREKWLLDLVALGTICDVVPLIGENRILAYYGLKVARQSRRPAFRALAEVSDVDLGHLQASDFGFRFGPRLNAAGRLEHARQALDLLMSDNLDEARRLARELDELNKNRRDLTARIVAEAEAQAEEHIDDHILVLTDPEWSHGIAGLVASRIAEQFGRPAIILQTEGEIAKGSARSVGEFSLIEALRAHDELFLKYGGHAAAAGMTLAVKQVDELRRRLNASFDRQDHERIRQQIICELELRSDYVSPEGLAELEKLEPFGQGHPMPLLYVRQPLTSVRWVGRDESHAQIQFNIDGRSHRAIAFSARKKWPFIEAGQSVELALRLRGQEFRGVIRPDLEVVQMRPY